jgi:putative ABC transport system permease protein
MLGVATAMFLFCAVHAMKRGVDNAIRRRGDEATLVVYRENRFCPFTSQLPENYGDQIGRIDGVKSVTPMMILVNNCRAGLDVVTFRGVPAERLSGAVSEGFQLAAGNLEEWANRTDGALVGERLAARRNLKVGDRFSAAGITIHVSGILSSSSPQDQTVAYVHLGFLQRAAGNRQGVVTQFIVTVNEPGELDGVAARIDDHFRHSQAPTWTAPEKAFTARAVADIVELVGFAGWLGWGSLLAVFALVANSIVLSVNDRVKDHAVMQTLGYSSLLIGKLIVLEGLLVSLAGGLLGLFAATLVSLVGRFTVSAEGLSIVVEVGLATILVGLFVSVLVGVLASLAPAWRAGRLSTAEAFRAV